MCADLALMSALRSIWHYKCGLQCITYAWFKARSSLSLHGRWLWSKSVSTLPNLHPQLCDVETRSLGSDTQSCCCCCCCREWILHGRQPPQLAHVQQQIGARSEQPSGSGGAGVAGAGAGAANNGAAGQQQEQSKRASGDTEMAQADDMET